MQKLGRYDLIRVLGKGAMGLVYEGKDPNLDRRVAIKTIKVENLSEEGAAEYEVRFRTEARSAARLQHPNIVSVYDSDRDVDVAFLVMEFIQGDDLKHHLDKGERYSLEQVAGIMNDLLSALDYAHRQNVVHRDVKPANLLIEPSGRVKLTDFGVARIQDSGEATRTQGTMVGTLKYMSPEQVQGLPIDARSDLFAAGIVLYQLLTGKRPFDGAGDYDIIQQIISKPATPPSAFNPNLPPEIDAVVARALEKSRDNRFPTALEFNQALQAAAKFAMDATIALPQSGTPSGPSATWTSTLLAGEALVNTSAGSNSGVSASTVTQEVELVYWKEVKDSVDAEDLHGFLSKFPSGIYADLARRRLKRLEVEEDPSSGSQSGTRTRLTTSTAVKAAHPAEDDPENVPAIDSADSPAQPEAAPRNGASPFIGAQPSAADAVAGVVANPVPAKPVTTPMDRDRPVPARAQLVAGVVVAILGILVVAYFLLSGTQELDPVPPVQVTLEPGKEPTPGNKEMDAGVVPPPVVTSSKPMPVIPSVAASAASTPKKPVTSSQPSERAQSPSAAGKTPGAPAMPAKQVEAPQAPAGSKSTDTPASAASTDPAAGGDPGKACEGRWLLSFQTCMSEQCSKPQFVNHAVCVERRAMEKRNLDGEQRTGR